MTCQSGRVLTRISKNFSSFSTGALHYTLEGQPIEHFEIRDHLKKLRQIKRDFKKKGIDLRKRDRLPVKPKKP